jgi:hypothetical protein
LALRPYQKSTIMVESFTASDRTLRLDVSTTSNGTIADASQNFTGLPAVPR